MDLELLTLPDDALLAVLGWLTPRELIRCRVVCRKLRDFCLHADLWRSVRLLPYEDEMQMQAAALRLAPCLRELVVWDVKAVAAAVSGTACVVARLGLHLRDPADVALAKNILRKIAALGGLRELELHQCSNLVQLPASLLKMVFTMRGLRELNIRVLAEPGIPVLTSLRPQDVSPSLTHLSYGYFEDSFLQVLLVTHASTLEDVRLYTHQSLPASLFHVSPRLRSLTCHVSNGLVYAEALSNIQTLSLLSLKNECFPPRALDFLRQSSQLRSVDFPLPQQNPSAPLQALAASPSARALETLTVRSAWRLVSVAEVLPRLPALRSLSLHSHGTNAKSTNKFFKAVSPTTAPRLTSLTQSPDGGCPHAWLHGPAVLDLLARNPGLHLRVDASVEDKCDCPWCCWGCHKELKGRESLLPYGFASHTPGAGCPSGCSRWP